MPNTAARRRTIRRILSHDPVSSQTVLVERLSAQGFEVTQATVSRDLRELGAIKVRDGSGASVYALPTPDEQADQGRSEQTLRRALVDFALTITSTSNLVVVRTPPGAAQVVAGALDHSDLRGVLGTVAGDDTVLVVVEDRVGGWRIAKQLEQIGAGT